MMTEQQQFPSFQVSKFRLTTINEILSAKQPSFFFVYLRLPVSYSCHALYSKSNTPDRPWNLGGLPGGGFGLGST